MLNEQSCLRGFKLQLLDTDTHRISFFKATLLIAHLTASFYLYFPLQWTASNPPHTSSIPWDSPLKRRAGSKFAIPMVGRSRRVGSPYGLMLSLTDPSSDHFPVFSALLDSRPIHLLPLSRSCVKAVQVIDRQGVTLRLFNFRHPRLHLLSRE